MEINSFLADVISYSLKTPEIYRFSGVFRRYKMRAATVMGYVFTWYPITMDALQMASYPVKL